MKFLTRAIVGVGLLISANPACANILTVVYTGTVITGTDSTGVFGFAGRSLAGLNYIAAYRFDDSLGNRTTISPYLDDVIGGAYNGTNSPSLGASLTINGFSFAFNGLGQGYESNFPLGSRISSSASDTSLFGYFDASFVSNALTASNIPSSMDTPFSTDGILATNGINSEFQIAFGPNGTMTQNASGTLSPTNVVVTVQAIPEPATWAMTIIGFSVLGGALRGKPRRKTVDIQAMPAC